MTYRELEVEMLRGKRIEQAVIDDDGHLILSFDDGISCTVEGVGYDGLWTDVVVLDATTSP